MRCLPINVPCVVYASAEERDRAFEDFCVSLNEQSTGRYIQGYDASRWVYEGFAAFGEKFLSEAEVN